MTDETRETWASRIGYMAVAALVACMAMILKDELAGGRVRKNDLVALEGAMDDLKTEVSRMTNLLAMYGMTEEDLRERMRRMREEAP